MRTQNFDGNRLGPLLLALAIGAGCEGLPGTCLTVGEAYDARNPGRCCGQLSSVNVMYVPSDEPIDALAEGCGIGDAPPAIMVCVDCGDGSCGEAEHFCNCPEDCSPE